MFAHTESLVVYSVCPFFQNTWMNSGQCSIVTPSSRDIGRMDGQTNAISLGHVLALVSVALETPADNLATPIDSISKNMFAVRSDGQRSRGRENVTRTPSLSCLQGMSNRARICKWSMHYLDRGECTTKRRWTFRATHRVRLTFVHEISVDVRHGVVQEMVIGSIPSVR